MYTCCKEDFKFRTRKDGGFINQQKEASTPYKKLVYIQFQWRYQKNKNHGERIKFQAIPDNINNCPCYAAHQIAQRFVRLKAPKNTLLATYRKNNKSDKYFYLIKVGIEKKL